MKLPLKLSAAAAALTLTLTTVHGATVFYVNENFNGFTGSAGDQVPTSAGSGQTFYNLATGNVTFENALVSTGDTSNDPTGFNLRVDGNRDKGAAHDSLLTLDTDGITQLTVSFKLYFGASDPANNAFRLMYDSDALLDNPSNSSQALRRFTTTTTPANIDIPNGVYGAQQWYAISLVVNESDVTGGAFTDKAQFAFFQDEGGSTNSAFYIDDVVISGIPEPSSFLLGGLGTLLLLRRRRS